MQRILKIGLGLMIALSAAGCAVVPAYDAYYQPQVTVVTPAPRYYATPVPRYYVVPGRPHHYHHGGGHRRW